MSDSPLVIDPPSTPPELLCRTAPMNMTTLAELGLSPSECGVVELPQGSELNELVLAWLAKNAIDIQSHGFAVARGGGCCDEDDDGTPENDGKRVVRPTLGLGLHRFHLAGGGGRGAGLGLGGVDGSAATFYALLQTLGSPVGTDCGAAMYKSLVLIAPSRDISPLKALCDELVAEADRVHPHRFTIWRWSNDYCRWMRSDSVAARPIDSVVLPAQTQQLLIEDLDDFHSRETRSFYVQHGIPHKRSYLFHGSPGSGKTSTIQALAGRYGRNVCYLAISPEMSDDKLKSAIDRVPSKSIIVMEDVDALFNVMREKSAQDKSPLTFSGLLNSLDGVGGSVGQIFILTTNHPERLDPALVRNGRVDVAIEFTDATTEQAQGLFRQFYPAAPAELAAAFQEALWAQLGERTVSMAALQHFFILMRKKTAEEAARSSECVISEMETRMAMRKADETATKNKAKASQAAAEGGGEGEQAKQPKAGGDGETAAAVDKAPADADGTKQKQVIHVHLHSH